MIDQAIQAIHPLPKEVIEAIIPFFYQVKYPKNYHLLRQEQYSGAIWYLAQGAARYYHIDKKGRDRTIWFSFKQDFITADAPTLFGQVPAKESIQLTEDSLLFYIDYQNVRKLLEKYHSFTLWYIHVLERFYIPQLEDRIADLQFLNAQERYLKLLEQFPGITNRVNLGHIASYLNITQETLSRIRAELAK